MISSLDNLREWIKHCGLDDKERQKALRELARCYTQHDTGTTARALRDTLKALPEKTLATLLLEDGFYNLVVNINTTTLEALEKETSIKNTNQLRKNYPIITIKNNEDLNKPPVLTIASLNYYEQYLDPTKNKVSVEINDSAKVFFDYAVKNITCMTDDLLEFVKKHGQFQFPMEKDGQMKTVEAISSMKAMISNGAIGLCKYSSSTYHFKQREIEEALPKFINPMTSVDFVEILVLKLIKTLKSLGEEIIKDINEKKTSLEITRKGCAPIKMEKMLLVNEITNYLKKQAENNSTNIALCEKTTDLTKKMNEAIKEYKQKFDAISDVIDVKYKDLVADYKGESKILFRNTYDRNYIIAARTTMFGAMNKLGTLAKIKYAHDVLTNKYLSDYAEPNPAAKAALNAVNYCLALQIINCKDPLSLLSSDQPSRKLWIKIGESYNKKEAALNSETKKQMIEVLKTYIRTCSKSAKDILKNLESDTPTKDPFIDCCVAELQKHRLGRKKGTYGIDTKSYKQILEYVRELAGPKLTNKTEIVATKTTPEEPKISIPVIL